MTTGQLLYVYWINRGWGQIYLSNTQTHLANVCQERQGTGMSVCICIQEHTNTYILSLIKTYFYIFIYVCLYEIISFWKTSLPLWNIYCIHILYTEREQERENTFVRSNIPCSKQNLIENVILRAIKNKVAEQRNR